MFCWHKWKPHHRQVRNVREYQERAAMAADLQMAAMFGSWNPPGLISLVAKMADYPNEPGMVRVGDKCSKCGKVR